MQFLPLPRTQADFGSVCLYKGPPTSEQPAAALNNTQRGSNPPSRAKLTAPTPAEGNDATGPSGAGQSGSVEAGPPATHAPARVIETTKKPNNEPKHHRAPPAAAGVLAAAASDALAPGTPVPATPNTVPAQVQVGRIGQDLFQFPRPSSTREYADSARIYAPSPSNQDPSHTGTPGP